MDANNLSLAVTTRMLEDATGDERLSASFGEIRYFDDQRVEVPNVPPTDFGGSTYAGELDLHLSDRWRVTLDQQWNPNTERTDLLPSRCRIVSAAAESSIFPTVFGAIIWSRWTSLRSFP